ncbi:hypothetical protein [uncultured Methylobacterium sp.]|uniref:hypothetical protein n=1 Tax=uncultured Methylobacterium sp. TaxID=157278 RepID=UPI002599029B|nr:hypothetical protein [uncultured Methylobacterium sp.]
MSCSPNNIVRLFPRPAYLTATEAELAHLRMSLAKAKNDFLRLAVEFDHRNVELGHDDPELRSHVYLSKIDRLEDGVAALADAVQALRAPA